MASKIFLFLVIIVLAITFPTMIQIIFPFPYGIGISLITPFLIWKIILKIDKQDRSQNSMPITKQVRSNAWFLLPMFLHVIGGVITFYVLRKDDPIKAKNCLLLGAALLAAPVATVVTLLMWVGVAQLI